MFTLHDHRLFQHVSDIVTARLILGVFVVMINADPLMGCAHSKCAANIIYLGRARMSDTSVIISASAIYIRRAHTSNTGVIVSASCTIGREVESKPIDLRQDLRLVDISRAVKPTTSVLAMQYSNSCGRGSRQ